MGTRTRAKSSPVVLENIVDTGTEGTRVATGTEAQRGTTEGQLRYNTEIDGLEVRNASAHVVVKSQTDVLAWTTAAGSLLSGHSVGSAITNINLAAESATGGAVTYAVQSGSLTAGLSMSTGGVISGTPTGVGTANFTVRATTGSNTSDRAFTINTIQSAYTAEIMVVGGGGSGGPA